MQWAFAQVIDGPVRTKDPVHEKEYVKRVLAPVVRRLERDENEQVAFLAYARAQGGADALLFPSRLARVLKGEHPTAYMAVLLLEWSRARSARS